MEANTAENVENVMGDNENVAKDMCKDILGDSVFVGIDFGNESTVAVTCTNTFGLSVEENRLGNRSTPTVLAFDGKQRIIGEEAESRYSSIPLNTIWHLPMWLGISTAEDFSKLRQRLPFLSDFKLVKKNGFMCVTVQFADKDIEVPLEVMFAHYIREILSNINTINSESPVNLTLAVSSVCSDTYIQHIYGVKYLVPSHVNITVLSKAEALFNCWVFRHVPAVYTDIKCIVDSHTDTPDVYVKGGDMYIGLIDMGFADTSILIVKLSPKDDQIEAVVAAQKIDNQLGVCDLVSALLYYVKGEILKKYKQDIKLDNKKGQRLFNNCEKVVRDLSGLNESSIDIEGFLQDEMDLRLVISREVFEDVSKPFADKLELAMQDVLKFSGIDDKQLLAVDVVGGGCRIPFVTEIIQKYIGGGNLIVASACNDVNTRLLGIRRTLDGTSSVAMGAAYYSAGCMHVDPQNKQKYVDTFLANVPLEHIQLIKELDLCMRKEELEEIRRLQGRNFLESFLLDMQKTAKGGSPFSKFIHKNEDLAAVLKDTEDWFWDNPDAPLNDITNVHTKLESRLKDEHKDYFEAIRLDKIEKDKQAEMHAANNIKSSNGEDMDVKLPNSQCLKRAKKNKDEGNTLFKDGNGELAVQRYIKSLQYLSKMFDMSETDQTENTALKLSVHLNLAQAYIKLAGLDTAEAKYTTFTKKAISSCDSALELDPSNVKALYRRALAREKLKDYDLARLDVKQAMALSNEPDFVKLNERLERLIKLEKGKQKKVYQKMFA